MYLVGHTPPATTVLVIKSTIQALFLVLLPFRLWQLKSSSVKVRSSLLGRAKAVLCLILPVLEIGSVVRHFQRSENHGPIFIATAVVSVSAALAYCVLSYLEHIRSWKPSTLIVVFLSGNFLCNLFQWALQRYTGAPHEPALSLNLGVWFGLLLVESCRKNFILLPPYQQLSPEETSGVIGNALFFWINPILAKGYGEILEDATLPPLDTSLSTQSLRVAALRCWDQRSKPETSWTLPKVLLKVHLWPFIFAAVPRLFLILFRYSQPLLIRQAILYVNNTGMQETSILGFYLIVAAATVYTGLAVSIAVYQHQVNRLQVMMRGALIGLLYNKSLNSEGDQLSAGSVVTLMSNDVDNLSDAPSMFHETWAQVLEVAVGLSVLASQIGWLWPLPLCLIILGSRVSRYVARNLRSMQGSWNAATQNRITITGAVVGAIKNVKMLGLQGSAVSYIERLRGSEIEKAGRVRWMMLCYNISANALGIFTPMVTIVLFAALEKLRGQSLRAETAFTTFAVLGMVTHPANMVMTIVPRAIASFSSFERIQRFLLKPDLHEKRTIVTSRPNPTDLAQSTKGTPSIAFKNVTVIKSRPLLQDVSFEVPAGSVVICAGPTASGKTTLVRTIIGELAPSQGEVIVSTRRIGYCAQSSWLPNTTIRKAIESFSPTVEVDKQWYQEVVRACCLQPDFDSMQQGDGTLVGFQGMNLSGGQRQRIAIARALYSRCPILVLDDTLSGLDGNTENQLVNSILCEGGLARKLGLTIFLISNAAQHFHLADHVIVLEDARIEEQGSWDQLKSRQDHITKIIEHNHGASSDAPRKDSNLQSQVRTKAKAAIEIDRQGGDSALYGYYIRAAGVGSILLLLATTISYSFFIAFPQFWMKFWTDSGESSWFYIAGFAFFTFMSWTSTCTGMWTTATRIAPQSGLELHSRLLRTVMTAPLSYFSKTETGEVLNRFSEDIQLVDKQLPTGISTLFTQIFKLLVQVIFLFIASKYMVVTLPACLLVVYIVQKVYLRTSRQLRLLELESRSGVLANFLETVEGISTIRAFQGQDAAKSAHTKSLDISQKPFYLLLCLQRWLKIVLDLIVAAIAVGVIALAVLLHGTTTGGEIGIALNIVLVANTTLLALVEAWTNMEISLGAIARLKNLESQITPEDLQDYPSGTADLLQSLPEPGVVELNNITAAYNPDAVALKSFSLKVDPGQLIVLYGRTGRGKSSVLLTLLKMLDVQAGTARVNGLDIKQLSTTVIRESFFITIPQDANLIDQASLRFNVDPSETLGNGTIVQALEKTGLWQHFLRHQTDTVTADALLDSPLSSLAVLSGGQRQLLALARALLQVHRLMDMHYKPILLLDEATSSVDSVTERSILSIVQTEFIDNGYTVIMVSHRLGAVADILRDGVDKMVEV
ncbi:ABC transporter [Xylariales sp. PMI_506]|nr:ABC transporter [Xylariales sp. PMI_506]